MKRTPTLLLITALTLAGCGSAEEPPRTGYESRREIRGIVTRHDEALRHLDLAVDGKEEALSYVDRTQVVDRSGARRSIQVVTPGTPVQVMVRPNETGALVIEALTILPPVSPNGPFVIEPPEND